METYDPLNAHLFNLPGQKWRDLRVKLSPTFTSGKLKGMFPVIRDCGKILDEYLLKNVNDDVGTFEFRELLSRFNTSIISSVAYGIDNDCINEPDHIFRKMGIKNFESTWRPFLHVFISFLAPKLVKKMKFKIIDPEVEAFIFSIVKQTIEYREKNNFSRNDFMQLLIQLKNEGYVSVDKEDKDSENQEQEVKKITLDDIAAQAFMFFVAGSDTSSSTMSFCLFELARNPDYQRKAQEEIDRVWKSSVQDEITYEMLSELKYLECCVDETLRKYPIAPILMRLCTEDYKVPDTELIIEKGSNLMIPVMGYHRDEDIYENPLEFKPERFLKSPHGDGKGKGLFYVPFGDGPRNCIGMRIGKLTAKLALFIVLRNFTVELEDKSLADKELEFQAGQFVLTPKNNFNLKVTLRSKKISN